MKSNNKWRDYRCLKIKTSTNPHKDISVIITKLYLIFPWAISHDSKTFHQHQFMTCWLILHG